MKCKMKYRKFPYKTIQCSNCGADITVRNNRYAGTCSNKCYKVWQAEKVSRARRKSLLGTLLCLLVQAKTRAKKKGLEFDLDKEWAITTLEKQNGKCKATGRTLVASKKDSSGKHGICQETISLDREANSKGYTKDNTNIVCYHYNVAKNKFSTEELLSLCKDIIKTDTTAPLKEEEPST